MRTVRKVVPQARCANKAPLRAKTGELYNEASRVVKAIFATAYGASGKPLEKIAAQSARSFICARFAAFKFMQQSPWHANVDDQQVANKFSATLDNATRSDSHWLLRSPSLIAQPSDLLVRFLTVPRTVNTAVGGVR
jgi:hypothetical protein